VQLAARSRQAMMAPAGDSDAGRATITNVEQIYAFDIIAQTAEALDGAR
jgi:hypothetical protein